jgi:hypothetical protein
MCTDGSLMCTRLLKYGIIKPEVFKEMEIIK